MRYAIISDIHSNLEALAAVLDEIETLAIDKTVCLGDIVGYNADPNECVEMIRERAIECVMGNHDSRAAGLEEAAGFNPHALAAILWTRDVLTKENSEYLKELPRVVTVGEGTAEGFIAVHGWINDTDSYIMTRVEAEANLALMEEHHAALCFFGHTHQAVTYGVAGGETIELDGRNKKTVKTDEFERLLINPGSVGQPRDRDPRAGYAVYDTEKKEVALHRVEYDINVCRGKILKLGLGRFLTPATAKALAERLRHGH